MVHEDETCPISQTVNASPCLDVAVMQPDHLPAGTTTADHTEVVNLNMLYMPYVSFQQLFFKNSTYSPNDMLVRSSDIFRGAVENKNRLIADENGCPVDNEEGNSKYNLLQQMIKLYENDGGSLQSCWDKCSKIKLTKELAGIKTLFDFKKECPSKCALNIDDIFCALEASTCEDVIVVDEVTNMPEVNNMTPCLPCLHSSYSSNLEKKDENDDNDPGNYVKIVKHKFVVVYDKDTPELCGKQELKQFFIPVDTECEKVCPDITADCIVDCSGDNFASSLTDNKPIILVSAVHIDGIMGAGGQYVIQWHEGDSVWKVYHHEKSAILNITTRLSGEIPDDSNDGTECVSSTKLVNLDTVWKFKVDLTSASSGSGGFKYEMTDHDEFLNTEQAIEAAIAAEQAALANGQSQQDATAAGEAAATDVAKQIANSLNRDNAAGWSQSHVINKHSDDRQRKCIPRDQSLVLVESMKKIQSDMTGILNPNEN